MSWQIIKGDARQIPLVDNSVHCVATSPPYFGLRNYGVEGQIGLEKTPQEYIASLVDVFREVRRVLHPSGTLWLNLGDSYAANRGYQVVDNKHIDVGNNHGSSVPVGFKPKDLLGIPFRVAFALQDGGWYLRSIVPWLKRNAMPESVRDRPGTAVEYVFLLSKSQRYFYDAEAVKVTSVTRDPHRPYMSEGAKELGGRSEWKSGQQRNGSDFTTRNRRNSDSFFESWQGLYSEDDEPLAFIVNPYPFKKAHFATFPPKLIEPMVKAGTSEYGCCPICLEPWARIIERSPMEIRQSNRGEMVFGNVHPTAPSGTMTKPSGVTTIGWRCNCEHKDETAIPCTVFDPFVGAGTTVLVAHQLGRSGIGLDLKEEYCQMAENRISEVG